MCKWFGTFVTLSGDNDTVYYVLDYVYIDLQHKHGKVDWSGMNMAKNGLYLMKADGTFVIAMPDRLEKTDKKFELKDFKKDTEVQVINPKRNDYQKIYKVARIGYPFLALYTKRSWDCIYMSYLNIQIV